MATLEVRRSWADVDPAEWDALVGEHGSPFLESAFLFALEATGAATPETGWTPRPVLVRDDSGRLVAGAPAWLKTHSMGEFVYDHGWAAGAEQAGIPYYPKLVVAVPFTPVTGDRLLVRSGEERSTWVPLLLQGLQEAAREARGVHVLFDPAAEAEELRAQGLFPRLQFQFHWTNAGWATHDEFLGAFRSEARKKLRRERREVSSFRFERVVAPDPERIAHLFAFYADTTEKYVWGRQYLPRTLFDRLGATWGHRMVAVLAWQGDRCVAGALDVFKGDRLYGRYWGCRDDVKFLHFEVCYHQGIEFCLERGLKVFEPGHGGEHKYRRGFLPEITWSSHAFGDPRLARAFADHARREATAVQAHVEELRQRAPFRQAGT